MEDFSGYFEMLQDQLYVVLEVGLKVDENLVYFDNQEVDYLLFGFYFFRFHFMHFENILLLLEEQMVMHQFNHQNVDHSYQL